MPAARHTSPTQGLSLSPILAAFHRIPRNLANKKKKKGTASVGRSRGSVKESRSGTWPPRPLAPPLRGCPPVLSSFALERARHVSPVACRPRVFRLPLSRVEQRGRLHLDVRARADEKHGYDGQGLLVEQGRHGCAHPSKPRAWRQTITHTSPLQPFEKRKNKNEFASQLKKIDGRMTEE